MRRVQVVSKQITSQPVSARSVTVTDNVSGKSCVVPFNGSTVNSKDVQTAIDELTKEKPHRESLAKERRLGKAHNNHVRYQYVQFIGAPFADGQNLFGNELFPTAMRDAGLENMVNRLGWDFSDIGDLAVEGTDFTKKEKALASYREWVRSGTNKSYVEWSGNDIRDTGDADSVHVHAKPVGDPYDSVKNSELVGRGCELVYEQVFRAASEGKFPLTVGGDHSIGSATLAAMVQAYPNLAVVWVDAHADANTPETSPSLHYHGMPAAHALGWFTKSIKGFEWLRKFVPESRLAYIGLRDIDAEEGKALAESGVHVYTVAHIDRLGISQVVASALDRIDPYNNRPLYLTLDVDAIDPVYAPGTGTLARGGLTYREAHYVCEEMAASNRLVGMDIVEVNPLIDTLPYRMHGDDPSLNPTSTTVHLALELVLSGLGKNILNADILRHPVLVAPAVS